MVVLMGHLRHMKNVARSHAVRQTNVHRSTSTAYKNATDWGLRLGAALSCDEEDVEIGSVKSKQNLLIENSLQHILL